MNKRNGDTIISIKNRVILTFCLNEDTVYRCNFNAETFLCRSFLFLNEESFTVNMTFKTNKI